MCPLIFFVPKSCNLNFLSTLCTNINFISEESLIFADFNNTNWLLNETIDLYQSGKI